MELLRKKRSSVSLGKLRKRKAKLKVRQRERERGKDRKRIRKDKCLMIVFEPLDPHMPESSPILFSYMRLAFSLLATRGILTNTIIRGLRCCSKEFYLGPRET